MFRAFPESLRDSLIELRIKSFSGYIYGFPGIERFLNLRILETPYGHRNPDMLRNMHNLEWLTIWSGSGNLANVIPSGRNLKYLDVSKMSVVYGFDILETFPVFETLIADDHLNNSLRTENLKGLAIRPKDLNHQEYVLRNLRNLEQLRLNSSKMKDLTGLAHLENLQVLILEDSSLQSLKGIEAFPNLRVFRIRQPSSVAMATLMQMTDSIEEIDISCLPKRIINYELFRERHPKLTKFTYMKKP
jgi:hypothetical protein